MISALLLLLVGSAQMVPSVQSLWPEPAVLTSGTTVMTLSEDLRFTKLLPPSADEERRDCPPTKGKAWSNGVLDAAINATRVLLHDGFVPYMLHAPGASFEPDLNVTHPMVEEVILLQRLPDPVTRRGRRIVTNETYTLDVRLDGKVTIEADSSLGLAHGLSSLTQLFYTSTVGTVYTRLAPIYIVDAPAFEWRGLNLDVARNFIPVQRIKRIIDVMSWNKMNRLHLHATDSQSWPLEIPALPDLASRGAFACEMTYSVEEFAHLQRYANLRGIELVTEIDMPGHTAAIHGSAPELIAGYNVQAKGFADSSPGSPDIAVRDWSAYCAEPPCGQLKLNSSEVDVFLRTLLDDLLPRTTNHTSFFHMGGDEVNKNVYLLQEGLGSNDSRVLQPLLSKLVHSVHDRVRAHGLTPIVWEEMILDWNLTLSRDTLVQSWVDPASIKSLIERGYHVIAGSSGATYLDCGKGQWLDFTDAAVPYQASQGFVDYCSPFKNWKSIYQYDPLFNLSSSEVPFVQGFEVHAWSEQIDAVNVELAIWPRAAAAAEVGWSGSTSPRRQAVLAATAGPRRKVSMERVGARLSEWRERMVHRGIQVEPIHSRWCTQRPGQCSL